MRLAHVEVLFALSLALPALTAAQTANQIMPPNYPGVQTRIAGIYVTPIPNFPFSAEVEIVSHLQMPDGSDHVVMTTNHIARASSGRIYNERRRLVPAGFKGTPPLIESHIYDPSTRQNIFINPYLHLAREMTLRAPLPTPAGLLPPQQQRKLPGVTETDLGTQMLDGVELHGTRKQRTIPADFSGTGKPVVITDDYWYSPDLAIYMTIRHDDPRTGEQLVAVTHIDRTEPAAETFVVPPEDKLVDETTDNSPRARQ
ncbi:MAG TPA: hypothetical protein VGU25_18095 [Acidobacteriaceae bacterium]|nr:hypothetical protein [Acidobacteriaceae bacterium]